MNNAKESGCEINIHLAADAARGSVDPCNDQIWRLTSEEGEPEALSLNTTYGLRAYAMRIFPRFHIKGEIVQNPRAYSSSPKLMFSACDFARIHFSPFPTIDVKLRLWVPTSQIVVGQIEITSKASLPEPLAIEWVCMLEAFPGGSPMTVEDQRINTILAGKTSDLEPVFLLTGMPKAATSIYPGLISETSLRPGIHRQFTWVMSTLENKDLSFYAARKYTASNLEVEELKIELSQKMWLVNFHLNNDFCGQQFTESQSRAQQLILPSHGSFLHPSVIHSRAEDNGFSRSGKGDDSGESWGMQTACDIFLASRIYLPSYPEMVKGLLQNILEMQSDDGSLDMLISWNGKRSGRRATPILTSIVLDIFNDTQDLNWLKRAYAVLLESTKGWFTKNSDIDEDGFPEWQHPLQTGLFTTAGVSEEKEELADILVKTTESPALAALLWRECVNLIEMSKSLELVEDLPWLEQKVITLSQLVQSCWNEEASYFQYRDMLNHSMNSNPAIRTYRRNGHFPFSQQKASSSFTILHASLLQDTPHPFEILIQTPDQVLTVNERSCIWREKTGYTVLNIAINKIQSVAIRNLKKDESVSFSEIALNTFDTSSIIIFWAGIASEDQTDAFLQEHLHPLTEGNTPDDFIPVTMKYMLLEILVRSGRNLEALELMKKWFELGDTSSPGIPPFMRRKQHSLEDLIPMRIFLSIFGIEKWDQKEMIIKNRNISLPPITVQYEQAAMKLEQGKYVITLANGEKTTLNQAGKTKILIA